MVPKRDTAGKLALEAKYSDTPTHSVEEQMREQLTDYEDNITECIERSKKDFNSDFFVVVLTKKERLLDNVLRHFFFGRQSCPTPDWDQTVYHYHRHTDSLEFLWTVPSKHACQELTYNALNVPPEQRDLLNFVLEFQDGTLLRKAKKYNLEREDSNIIEK